MLHLPVVSREKTALKELDHGVHGNLQTCHVQSVPANPFVNVLAGVSYLLLLSEHVNHSDLCTL